MNIYRQFCRCWLACLLLLGFQFHAGAATLFQWSFDGPPGGTLSSSADSVSGVVVTKFNDATLSAGATNTIQYGPPNPWYNHNGTSADFQNTVGDNDPGVGLFINDAGVNSPLDLSTLTSLTIESFVYPYDIRQSVIIRKYGSGGSGFFYIDIRTDGRFGFRLKSASQDLTDQLECNDLPYTSNQWYHVALIWDGAAVTFYVNGVQSHDLGTNHLTTIPFSGPIADSNYGLGIGTIVRGNSNPPANSGQFFFGRIDEIRISDAALSPGQFLINQATGAADHLAMGQQPGNTTTGQSIYPSVTVQVLDQFGNLTVSTTNVTVAIGNNPAAERLVARSLSRPSPAWQSSAIYPLITQAPATHSLPAPPA